MSEPCAREFGCASPDRARAQTRRSASRASNRETRNLNRPGDDAVEHAQPALDLAEDQKLRIHAPLAALAPGEPLLRVGQHYVEGVGELAGVIGVAHQPAVFSVANLVSQPA